MEGVQQERLGRAIEVLQEMVDAGVQPDAYTYSMLIFACSMVKHEKRAVKVSSQTQSSHLLSIGRDALLKEWV